MQYLFILFILPVIHHSDPRHVIAFDNMEGITLILHGIQAEDDSLRFHFQVFNRSPLSYEVDEWRWTIRDRKKLKRHAYQELLQQPLGVQGGFPKLEPGTERDVVFTLRKEVLSPYQHLVVQLLESHGSRNLSLSISYRDLLRAKIVKQM